MELSSVVNLVSRQRLDRMVADTRQKLQTSSTEAVTGVRTDLVKATNGNLRTLLSIDRALSSNEVYRVTSELADQRSQSMVFVMEQFLEPASEAPRPVSTKTLATSLIASTGVLDLESSLTRGIEARGRLESAISGLNISQGGRFLFSGDEVGATPLASADQILTDIKAIIAAAPDQTTAVNDINTYFNDPAGGFLTTIYGGSSTDVGPAILGEGDTVDYSYRADAQVFRDVIQGLSMAAAIERGSFGGDANEILPFLRDAGLKLEGAQGDLAAMHADMGVAQSRIAEAKSFNEAEATALTIARNNLVGRDQFEASNEVIALETQLETLFTVTGRLANLSLSNYLR